MRWLLHPSSLEAISVASGPLKIKGQTGIVCAFECFYDSKKQEVQNTIMLVSVHRDSKFVSTADFLQLAQDGQFRAVSGSWTEK